MKKIGFIDYYLSEWHANNYPAWIREIDPEFTVAYAYAELDRSPVDGVTTAEWCRKFGAEPCRSIAELCRKADCIFILSPDNPEHHLRYAEQAFPCGKPCYMDKTFAPDSATAQEIFDLAKRYGVKLFSSSALRFAGEFRGWNTPLRSVNISGSGRFDIYLIHFVEIAVRLMGAGVQSVTCVSASQNTVLTLRYPEGRTAILNLYRAKGAPSFAVAPESADPEVRLPYLSLSDGYFRNLIAEILQMFDGGAVPVREEETVAVMGILDAAKKAAETPWREIPVQRS